MAALGGRPQDTARADGATISSRGLCSDCQQFDLHSFASDPYSMRGYAVHDVVRRASFCDFCRLLRSCFEFTDTTYAQKALWYHMELLATGQRPIEDYKAPLGVVFIRVFLGERRRLKLGRNWCQASEKYPLGQQTLLHVCAAEGSPAAVSGDVNGRFYSRDILSTNNPVLEQWIDECAEHSACNRSIAGIALQPAHAAPLPTRCINVGTDAYTRLHIEMTSGKIGAYAILTHRWTSTAQQCCTNVANYRARLIDMDIWRLPPSFRESVAMTRRLGLQYLWVDSICIIQSGDDGRDWTLESTKMAEYYQNAFVTFAATTETQLLPDPSPGRAQSVLLPYRLPSRGDQAGTMLVHRNQFINSEYQLQVQDSDLVSRAWVFQEILLSRRIIWFTPTNIFLECKARSPMNEHGESLREVRVDGTAETLALGHKRYFALDSGSGEYLMARWYDVVEAYSSLHISFPAKDRSVALAGFAKEFGVALAASEQRSSSRSFLFTRRKRMSYRYVAGLWTHQVHVDLLWEQARPGPHDTIAGYPSWSWTGVYTGVLWLGRDINKSLSDQADSTSMSSKWGSPAYSAIEIVDQHTEHDGPCIKIKTVMQRVLVDRLLQGWEIEHLYNISYRPRQIDNLFRAVRPAGNSARVCGWASLEREMTGAETQAEIVQEMPPNLDDEGGEADALLDAERGADGALHAAERVEVDVLLVSTTALLPDDFRGGHWLPWSRAYNVLYVRRLEQGQYERIGVGVLFGKDVEVNWREPEDIILV